jgi:LEA14-like dessication related protein
MRKHLNRAVSVAAVAIVFTGCSAFGPAIEEPEVFLVGIRPVESTLFEHRVETSFRVRNPNDIDLEITGLDLEVHVNGTRLARVLSGETARVPRFGEATVSAIASTTTGELLRQFSALGRTEEPTYEISGYVYLGHSFARRRVKLSTGGKLLPKR